VNSVKLCSGGHSEQQSPPDHADSETRRCIQRSILNLIATSWKFFWGLFPQPATYSTPSWSSDDPPRLLGADASVAGVLLGLFSTSPWLAPHSGTFRTTASGQLLYSGWSLRLAAVLIVLPARRGEAARSNSSPSPTERHAHYKGLLRVGSALTLVGVWLVG
jgi:hypothetical protein